MHRLLRVGEQTTEKKLTMHLRSSFVGLFLVVSMTLGDLVSMSFERHVALAASLLAPRSAVTVWAECVCV